LLGVADVSDDWVGEASALCDADSELSGAGVEDAASGVADAAALSAGLSVTVTSETAD